MCRMGTYRPGKTLTLVWCDRILSRETSTFHYMLTVNSATWRWQMARWLTVATRTESRVGVVFGCLEWAPVMVWAGPNAGWVGGSRGPIVETLKHNPTVNN